MSEKISLEALLKQYFGYDSFRPGQKEIIESILQGKDSLAVMPTGGGKSICYQLPALVFKGLTVVVSPLISLMQDQVDALNTIGIDALVLNSCLDRDTYVANMDQIRFGFTRILYCAPETLATERIRNLLACVDVSCITIDEAHCISEWGHDFRPEYRSIASIRKLFPNAVCLALTATATEQVQQDIINCLKLKKPFKFVSSFNRKNIFLEVTNKHTKAQGGANNQVLQIILDHPNQSGIVYCFSRKQVDDLTNFLLENNINALPYHAGLTDIKRQQNQDSFVKDKTPIIVATLAFGMGINKPNVRFVIHYDMPKSIEQYYQEIGRAGRDGEDAKAILLYSFADSKKQEFFMQEKEGEELEIAQNQLSLMIDYCTSRTCRRQVLLNHFGESYQTEKSECCCDVCNNQDPIEVDLTIPSQKLLSCIIRTGERYGTSYIVEILIGSKSKRVLENHHQTLSTWGIGKEYTKNDWYEIVYQLIKKDILQKSEDFSVLSLTTFGRETLFTKKKIYLPFLPTSVISTEEKIEKTKKHSTELSESDNQGQFILLELKRIRKELAQEADIPPYMIFSDKTLTDIASTKPQTKEQLLQVNGIGEVKASKYGSFIFKTVEIAKQTGN